MAVSATYISATTFSVVGDQTEVFNDGRRVRATCSSVYKYGTIESSTYTSLTTVVLTATSDALNSGLTEVYYGIAADSIGSMPTHAHDTTDGEGGTLTFVDLSDTPVAYDNDKFLRSTTSGTEWATGAGGTTIHSELSNLDYVSAGHTGFSPTSHEHISTEITVSKINTTTYDTLQDWINNTQSSGRMSGAATTAHTDAITDVTISGAGSGEFKVSGDQTSCYITAEPILVDGSTNNDGYYTIASGVVYSGGKTTIPVEEAVGAVADGIIYNGTVDVSEGTGFIKQTDLDIGETVSFDIHADTNIILTDVTTNFLYVDYNAGTPDIKVTTDRDIIEHNKQFGISMIYRNGPRIWACSCGIYLPNFVTGNHERLLIARGYERGEGGEISEYGTRNIQATAGIFFKGATRVDTTAKASVDDKLTTVYYDGSAWVWTENETQIDNSYWNNTSTGLVELSNGRYAVHWVCIDYLSNIYVVYGRGDYTLPQAQLAGVPGLMPVVAYEFGIIAAKIIVVKGGSSFAELLSAYTQVIPSETPTVHNDLSGLNEGDYKHLTASEYSSAILDRDVPGNIGDTTPAEGSFTTLNITTASGLVLKASDDSEWKICVTTSGVLYTAAV